MVATDKASLGQMGEQVACDFLQSMGHRILDRNWRGSHLELDIVSEGPDGVHFVEVKSRKVPSSTTIIDQVNALKRKRVTSAAVKYLNKHKIDGSEVFFDVVSVLFDGDETRVQYYPQAWIPLHT